jgi:hypothetical protein
VIPRIALTRANLVAIRKRTLGLQGPIPHITPNKEHRRLLFLAREIVVEHVVSAIRPVVEPITHRIRLWYARQVVRQSRNFRRRALMYRPP